MLILMIIFIAFIILLILMSGASEDIHTQALAIRAEQDADKEISNA